MRLIKTVLFLCFIGVFVACGGGSSDSGDDNNSGENNTNDENNDDNNDDTDNTGSLAVSSNSLAAAFPEGLAISAFPQEVDSNPGEAAPGTVAIETSLTSLDAMFKAFLEDPAPSGEFDPTKEHPRTKLEESYKRLTGEAENCFDEGIIQAITFQNNNGEVCFGFDYGIVNGLAMGSVDQGKINNAINQQDLSIEQMKTNLLAIDGLVKPAVEDVCMVAVGRGMMNIGVSKVEAALKLFEGMQCQGAKDKIAENLPDVGQSIDYKSVFKTISKDGKSLEVSKATIERLADHDGKKRYKSVVAFSVNDGPLKNNTTTITLAHSPKDDDNKEYKGVLWLQGKDDSNYSVVTSVKYEKSGTTKDDIRLKYEVRNANINVTNSPDAKPIDSEGVVDYNAGADDQGNFGPGNTNDYIQNILYLAFDINPSTFAGKMSFWRNPGGNYTEAPRGFVSETTQDDEGKLSGCTYAGAMRDISIRKAAKDGTVIKPTGCYTPFSQNGACGNNGDNQGDNVWKQCFKQTKEGKYEIDTDKVSDAAGFKIEPSPPSDMPEVDLTGISGIGDVN